jgi:hypothetical protein
MKLLKEKKMELLRQKKAHLDEYHYYRDYQKELHTVCSNVDMILQDKHHPQREANVDHSLS